MKIDFDTDIENTRTPLEECCEGGSLSAGCYHDNCTGANSVKKFDLQDVTTWFCFKEVATTLGEDDAEWELGKVLRQINEEGFEEHDGEVDLAEECLALAFNWKWSIQGFEFWTAINGGEKPEDYDITPDTPSAKKATPALKELMSLTKDSDLEGMLGNVSEDNKHEDLTEPKETIGTLIEKLYNKLPHSGVQIIISEAGIYLTGTEMPTVNISKMEPEVIDKTFETFVECEGLWVDFQENPEDDYEE